MKTLTGQTSIIKTYTYEVSDEIYEQLCNGSLKFDYIDGETLHLFSTGPVIERIEVDGGTFIDEEPAEFSEDVLYDEGQQEF